MAAEAAPSCLEVRELGIRYGAAPRALQVAADVGFEIRDGECVGIVGESGSGKSQTCLALMGLLPTDAQVRGSVRFRGQELLGAEAGRLRQLRGRDIAMVFQDPMTCLTPHLRIGTQLLEVLQAHLGLGAAEASERAALMLARVGIDEPRRRLRQYPHELSGGMRQRVMIAMACLCRPSLLIADEPTTALDATVQAQVLAVLRALRAELGTALLLVTHDFALLAGMADRVVVMYAGSMIETAPASALFDRPMHPYTRGLLDCIPRWSGERPERLASIAGQPPAPGATGPGCAFAPRCPRAAPLCTQQRPALRDLEEGRRVACHFPNV